MLLKVTVVPNTTLNGVAPSTWIVRFQGTLVDGEPFISELEDVDTEDLQEAIEEVLTTNATTWGIVDDIT